MSAQMKFRIATPTADYERARRRRLALVPIQPTPRGERLAIRFLLALAALLACELVARMAA